MKVQALTLHQPYASLIVEGRKNYETRSWGPGKHRLGKRIAIHAGKRYDSVVRNEITIAYGGMYRSLPYGAIVGYAILENAGRVTGFDGCDNAMVRWLVPEPDQFIPPCDRRHGNFDVGRWAWRMTKVEKLDEPIECRGYQGIWTFDPVAKKESD